MAGRTDLDNHAKVGCMIDDVVRDEREAREAVTLSGGGHQPPPVVDQLQLREITSDFAEEVSEGGSDNSSVQKLAESLSAIVETLSFASKGKSKDKKGHWAQESSTGGQWQGTPQRQNAAENRQPWPQPKEAGRVLERPKEKGKGKGKSGGSRKARASAVVEERPKAREKASNTTSAGGFDTPRGCAPAKDGLMTWSRTRLKEKTPMKTNAGPKRTTRHSNWDTLAASLV